MSQEDPTSPCAPTKASKERKIRRRLFTIEAKTTTEMLEKGEAKMTELRAAYNKLEQLHARLCNLDTNVQTEMWESATEAQIEREILLAEEYTSKYIDIKTRIEMILEKSDCSNKSTTEPSNARRFKLPEIKFQTFNGDIRNWLVFWGQFSKIDQDRGLDEDDKMYYLRQSIEPGTDVYSLVASYPPAKESYKNCIEELKQRYARDDLLIEVYVRELLALVLKEKSTPIILLYDKLNANLRALESLGINKYQAFILPLIESALPLENLRIWERQKGLITTKNPEEVLEKLMNHLKGEIESMQRVEMTRSLARNEPTAQEATASCLIVRDTKKIPITKTVNCIWCDKAGHSNTDCYKIYNLTVEKRRKILKEKKCCPLCWKPGHHPKNCKTYVKCFICGKRHMTALCTEKQEQKQSDQLQATSTANLSNQDCNKETLLQTVVINVRNGNRVLPVRVLFDTGSSRSYIREDLVQKLGLTPTRQETLHHALYGGYTTKSEAHKVYQVLLENLDTKFNITIEALSQAKICDKIPKINLNNKIVQSLNKFQITLSDLKYNINEIGILIGADYAGFMMTNSMLVMEDGLVAIKTKLGWAIQGRQIDSGSSNSALVSCMSVSCANISLTDFWDLEVIGIRDPAEVKSKEQHEIEAVNWFEETVRTLPDGRYEVELPFKVGFDDLLSNYDKAKKRLDSHTKKLILSGKYQDYDTILKEWLRLGIIETTDMHHSRDGHYLPHKAVFKESSLTTSIRPVFDASCPDKNGLCLNACLDKGINFIELIPKLIIGFRKHCIGITSDIAKAFLEINLSPENREYLKFLWWQDESLEKVIEYRHCRVVFGLTCSPFLLASTINHHLNGVTGKLKETAKILKDSFYVDNCLISLDTEEEARKFIQEATQIMGAAKFNLRMWVTSPLKINESGKDVISVLGLNWDVASDMLSCNTASLPPPELLCKLTKRIVLSVTQKIFDPIGFTCPVTIVPRILLREMWNKNLSWDEELPQDLTEKFLRWYHNLDYLKRFKIPRRLAKNKINDCKLSLHMFCDASKHAIAACIFLRAEKENEVSVQLIAAKSRLVPPKIISIPRLELMSAVIGVRLLVETRKSLNLTCDEFCWTDSSVTLFWICNNLTWNVFVGNRVKEIKGNTNIENWSHITGPFNCADLPSRGCDAKQLLESRWVEGPEFLRRCRNEWPCSSVTTDDTEAKKELRSTRLNCGMDIIVDTDRFSDSFLKISKYSKIVRVVAWILRFAKKCKNTHKEDGNNSNITSEEYENAEIKLIQLLQRENKDNLTNKCKNVHTFEDKNQLVRVKTRLLLSDMPENTKCPILLPGGSEIVRRLIEQRHTHLQHVGPNVLIANIRKSFWILGIRRVVRSVLNNCIVCKRYRTKQMQAPVAPLPVDRMQSSLPFEVTGIDLAGPLILKNGEKCWIVLYTCAVYRAVHLELTQSLSCAAFLMTLRRFIARRGRVKVIYSDNGTNLTSTRNLLNELDWNKIQQETCTEKIKWKLNAPTAAWWGGFFERLIGTLKSLLRKILGTASVTYDELHTLLCECESTMNSRPLTYVQDDSANSLEPLTPACFLQPLPESDTTDLDFMDATGFNIRLKYLHKLRDDFRHRFKTEYLTELVQRGKNKGEYREVKVGQVVLIETQEKRIKWPLGIITEMYPGQDGVNRTAKIKTALGFKIRPIQRLYPMEITSSEYLDLNILENRDTAAGKGKVTHIPLPISTGNDPVMEKNDSTGQASSEPERDVVTRHGRKIVIPSRYKV